MLTRFHQLTVLQLSHLLQIKWDSARELMWALEELGVAYNCPLDQKIWRAYAHTHCWLYSCRNSSELAPSPTSTTKAMRLL